CLVDSHALYLLTLFCLIAPAPSALDTLSLHDALPICPSRRGGREPRLSRRAIRATTTARSQTSARSGNRRTSRSAWGAAIPSARSEEHTSELQSRVDLVCRLLLEKKKTQSDET